MWRAYSGGTVSPQGPRISLEQVAELSVRGMPVYQLTWALLMLIAAYGDASYNIEVGTGGGTQVIHELNRVAMARGGAGYPDRLGSLLGGAVPYFYRRADSLARAGNVIHTVTTQRIRDQIFEGVRQAFERGNVIIRSVELVKEVDALVRTPAGDIDSVDGTADDRVIGMGLALISYEQLVWQLRPREDSYEAAAEDQRIVADGQTLQGQVRSALWDKIFQIQQR